MKRVDVKQGTRVWHSWRGKGLGASDAGTILGISPYKSLLVYILERQGRLVPEPFNEFAVAAMERGKKLEPAARAWCVRETGFAMEEDVCAEHEAYPYIRASYDGYNQEARVGLEIKCPGKVAHAKNLKTKKVPDIYYAQIQQQFLVGDLDRIDFVSYSGEDSGENIIIPVYPDRAYQQKLLEALTQAWEHITKGTLPPADPADRNYLLKKLAKATKEASDLSLALTLLNPEEA